MPTNPPTDAIPPLLGRLFLSPIFLASGAHKLTAWNETATRMTEQGLPAANVLLAGAVAFELLGGLSVLLGAWSRVGAVLLIAFLVPVTLVFHDFWTFTGAEKQQQMIHFMKNAAILGGLFVLLSSGSGRCSLDRLVGRSEGNERPNPPPDDPEGRP